MDRTPLNGKSGQSRKKLDPGDSDFGIDLSQASSCGELKKVDTTGKPTRPSPRLHQGAQ